MRVAVVSRFRTFFPVTVLLAVAAPLSPVRGQERAVVNPPLKHWSAPLYWAPTTEHRAQARRGPAIDRRENDGSSPSGDPSAPLMFVAVTPCRIMDTRSGSGFASPFGPPSLVSGSARTVPIPNSSCGIPASAAYSLNFTVIASGTLAYLSAWPDDQSFPGTSVLNDLVGTVLANNAVVPAGADGGIQVLASFPNSTTANLVIDINGYYTATPASLNLSGNISQNGTLFLQNQAGSNLGVGLGALSNGSGVTGTLNVAVGDNALSAVTSGGSNTALGTAALQTNTTGNGNSGFGNDALFANTNGSDNMAVGSNSLADNTTGSDNVAIGLSALASNTTSDDNTAIGADALTLNTGANNTAVGATAGSAVTSGANNLALGANAGSNVTTGNFNIHIANAGAGSDTNLIRIGDSNQTATFISGIRGTTTGNADAIEVMIDSNGQLGTVSSSRRAKTDIEDMPDTTSTIMQLHPVEFRYKVHGPDSPMQYGLIAEEVAEVAPDLVARDSKGEIETVYYNKVNAMMLQFVQTQQRTIDEQQRAIEELKSQIADLKSRLH